MPNRSKAEMFIPAIQSTLTLVIMAVVSIICFSAAFFSRIESVSSNYDEKVKAAQSMKSAMDLLKSTRMEKGVFVDAENDPNETGLVGAQFSLITTDEGDLDAKLTTLDPNFAAAMVELFSRAGVIAGDTAAVLMTGSMPGANMAVLIAAKTLGIHTVSISSIGASQWGANYPDFTWLDMEVLLYDNGFISSRSSAASIGGRNDLGRLLSPRGRSLILENIRSHNIPLVRAASLIENVSQRMEFYHQSEPQNGYSILVNIGGGVASLGTSFNHKLLSPGIVERSDLENITRPGGIEGVFSRLVREGVKAMHILNIQRLTNMLKMPYAPIPIPEIGKGPLYAVERYNLVVTAACLLIVSGMVFGVGFRSHNQIKRRMLEHEPDSVL